MILRDSFWKDWSSTLNTPGQRNLRDEKPITPYSILLVTNVTAAIPGDKYSLSFTDRGRAFVPSDLVPGVEG